MKVLDCGCGLHKRGTVGVDKTAYPNVDYVVNLDCEPLPFPDNSFDLVVSHHVVEHLLNPEYAIKEMIRVTNDAVKITCPHRYGSYAKISKDHKQFLNKRWFIQLGQKLRVQTYVHTVFMPSLHLGVIGLLMRPHELRVEFRKNMTLDNRS